MGRFAEAAGESRRALAVARQIGYPAGEAQALMRLGYAALNSGDRDSAVQLARQAAQITVGVPGVIARWCSYSLTVVLIGAGDLAAAEPVCAEALAWSRDTGDLLTKATLLQMMVTVDLAAGRIQDAAAHLRESLQFTRTGAWFSLFDDLDRCGHLCVATGRLAEALTVWAALVALVRRGGFLTYLPTTLRREEPLRRARQALGPVRARAAEDRGAAMSLDTAAEYALMLTDLAPPQPAATGPGALSARERELVTLVAQGRTDAQIAGQLYISIRTVRSHLDRIRDKTGCRRRADLTRLALAAGLV
jgi:DNA-binding CsgD family transcriptional regulator